MRTTLLFIAAALAAPLLLIGWLGRGLNDPASLALALALGAVCLGILGVIKSHMLEFSPEVLAGDVIIPRSSTARGDMKLLLPLQFLNSGATDGVVQWIALRLTIDGDIQRSVLLSPVAEVDMQRFIQAKRKLDGDNTIEPFTAFPLEAKRSMAKFVLFDIAERGRTQPLALRPGRYSFELFVKTTATRTHKLERAFEHQVEAKHVEEFRNDAPVYLIHYQMTLPSARREMTGAEWMPRTTRFSN
jgi:hypothetical protein